MMPQMSDVAGASGGADAIRARGLRRMQALALLLLGIAAAVFLATLHRADPWTFVHATAEAAMVGAIADWFAVTALFRHPLGLPIPHTAIIPTRKLALARSLEEFVAENFLVESVVRDRVASAAVSERVGGWLRSPEHAGRVVEEIAGFLRAGLAKLSDEEVAALLEGEVLPRLVAEPLSAVMGGLLQDVVDERAHTALVDVALEEAHRWLRANQSTVVRILGTRAPWWTPLWVDEKVTSRVYGELLAWVEDIRSDSEHEARRGFDALLHQLGHDLQHDADLMERAENLKVRVLTQPRVLTSALAIWNVVRAALVSALADPSSALRMRGLARLTEFGEQMVSDADVRKRIDGYAGDAAAFLVTRYGEELSTIITTTIDRWDGQEAARRIELHVGRDLQFIRINGTLVGGLAGLLIYSVGRLL